MMKIYEVLEDSYFTSSCFNIAYPDTGDIYFIITYLDNKKYRFQFNKNNQVEYAPGQLYSSNTVQTANFDICLDQIKLWVKLIRDEITVSNAHIFKEINELQ